MSEPTRWDALADALAVQDDLSEPERRFVAECTDPGVAQERAIYEELAAAGQPGPWDDQATDRQRAEATLAAFQQAHASSSSSGRGWVIGAGSTLLAVAAALVLWWAWPAPDAVLTPQATVQSGTLMLDGASLGPGESLPVDRWVIAKTRACVRTERGQGCASPRSRLRIHVATDGEQLEVADGALTFEGTGVVSTALGTVEAQDGRFELEISPQALHVEAAAGHVELRDGEGTPRALELGEPHTRSLASRDSSDDPATLTGPVDDPEQDDDGASGRTRRSATRRSPSASASELLGAARRHAASGDLGRALSTYATLRRQHAGSPEAHAANVSIGQLELRRGRAKAALRAFSRYLSGGGGALAEEAHWGKIRALHRLGRTKARDEAIAALRRSYPASVYLARASSL